MPEIDPRPPDAVGEAWNRVAGYHSSEQAQAAVDRLSDEGFPVEYLDVIGSDLRLVEHVTGRLTKGRAAGAGALGGAWFGLLVGLLVGLFAAGAAAWFALLAGAVLIGALWGAVFGWAGHAATGGRRDFSSTRALAASRYDLVARGGHADQARTILQREGLGGTV